jgi:hypothetical protein
VNAKEWLQLNKYDDVLEQIARLEQRWKVSGKGTRKSWWEKLAGGKDGEACVVDGEVFPVLKAAQKREGKPITKNAISRRGEVPPPPKKPQARWLNAEHN